MSLAATIFGGVVSLVKTWFEKKKSEQEAEAEYNRRKLKGEQNWDMEALRQARYSIKDEIITIIIFAPLVVAWFDEERSMQWVAFVDKMPFWYQVVMFGIVAASFGLRWFFKQQGFRVASKKENS